MVKRIISAVLLLLFTVGVVSAQETAKKQEGVWQVDPAHSSVYFTVRHLVISKVKGNFGEFDGTIHYDGKDFTTGSVEFIVKVASVNTDNEKRDNDLKSPDFFDAEKYPDMIFKSTKIESVDANHFKLTGNLTIKDVTKLVTFDVEFYGSTKDPWGGTRAGFSAATTINRQDFNITWSKALETGGLVVSDEVEINLDLELFK